MRKRVWISGAAALVLMTAAGAGFLAWRGEQACAPNRANADAAPDTAGPSGGDSAVILGDSLSTGWGLDNPSDSFAFRLADAAGWDATIDGFPGTGFAVDGACGDRSFDTRTAFPDVDHIVIEGGLNDAIFNSQGAPEAARGVIEAALKTGAHVYVVGLPTAPAVDSARAAIVNEELRRIAGEEGATFVALNDLDLSTTDGTHPDAASHLLIAERIAETADHAVP